ncbi:ribulose-phosphate 3-epimerase [Thermosipho melanesiensis]|uniref:Ribulose-phosphate 3-epimerase n=2 Tax=Thermosipho melanesiensis TaxID=46541 RepID=A6LN69_THEM4|nr:ribulose-phosphate 3-epimerase [Thermosipho melanesiensis]ABR31370.1 Ribulose-phosphate 3-epimerase [Thermosipho melanesiensis BI429]APT74430.1 ribulose-phosphate 3-epimerase [Thermosipho melanesiensis]OOC36392.1 ribulose-phosphate 3-epimerase [Thermosipho melanesiensis]OOC37210.1 ribulose-phosphate 3-epimerase [Thermosipho melanesiensis]OOC37962.1 ribulose-phosphate 3-epimerase [Thermosipho melanesiensis]
MVKLSGSILAANLLNLKEELKRVENLIDEIHIDVMDGHFVPNLTFGFPLISAVKEVTNLPIDVHLMVTNPEFHIEKLLDYDIQRITVHIESTHHIHRAITKIKENNIEAFVTLNPGTPLVFIEEVIPYIDGVLVMSVNPGFSGQKFIAKSIEKIKTLNNWKQKHGMNYSIAVDGGVNDSNADVIISAGANILIMGYGIFKNPELENFSKQLRKK